MELEVSNVRWAKKKKRKEKRENNKNILLWMDTRQGKTLMVIMNLSWVEEKELLRCFFCFFCFSQAASPHLHGPARTTPRIEPWFCIGVTSTKERGQFGVGDAGPSWGVGLLKNAIFATEKGGEINYQRASLFVWTCS